jgi:hypothetical protein
VLASGQGVDRHVTVIPHLLEGGRRRQPA